MTKIRAALTAGLPIPMLWDLKRNTWDAQGLLMLEAYQQYVDSLCGECGQSGVHALNVANTREFTVDTVTCLGCNVREVYRENHGETRTKGLKVYVVNRMGEGGPDDG